MKNVWSMFSVMVSVEAPRHTGFFGFGRKQKQLQEIKTYSIFYPDATTDMVRASNFPNESLESYGIHVKGEGMKYSVLMRITRAGTWGSYKFEHPRIDLSDIGHERNTDEVFYQAQVVEFLALIRQLSTLLRPQGKLMWDMEADFGGKTEASMTVIPAEDKLPPALSTKVQVANFVDSLPAHGIELRNWRMAWYSGLTMEEILNSNYPKEVWPPHVMDLATFQDIPLSK